MSLPPFFFVDCNTALANIYFFLAVLIMVLWYLVGTVLKQTKVSQDH